MNLKTFKQAISETPNLSSEALEAVKVIEQALVMNEDTTIQTTKRVLGELCRALQVKPTENIYGDFIKLWNTDEEVSINVTALPTLFETLGEAFKPAFTPNQLGQ